jgi:hypothetical protein
MRFYDCKALSTGLNPFAHHFCRSAFDRPLGRLSLRLKFEANSQLLFLSVPGAFQCDIRGVFETVIGPEHVLDPVRNRDGANDVEPVCNSHITE